MLYGWMKTLIVYLIFSGAVINMAPSGNYKKYINLFTGLIVIVILANPISYVFNLKPADVDILNNSVSTYVEYNQGMDAYEDIYDYYDMSLSEAIKLSLGEKGYSISEVKLITDENVVLRCTIVVENQGTFSDEAWENDIKNYISQVYNVDFDSIYIVRR